MGSGAFGLAVWGHAHSIWKTDVTIATRTDADMAPVLDGLVIDESETASRCRAESQRSAPSFSIGSTGATYSGTATVASLVETMVERDSPPVMRVSAACVDG